MAKIDMSEVKLLKEDLTKNADKATSAIAETKSGLGNIKDMASFEGDGAKATKDYITHAHNNLIEVYDNIIEDLKSNFTYSMDQFSSSVDNDASCIIDSSYVTTLKTEVTSATKSISSAIKSINKEISSISDITSASKVQTTDFKSDEKEFKKIITDMMDKFEAFVSASSNEVSQSREYISTLNSMQGQVQKISAVPDGVKTFKKSKVENFKSLIKGYKDIKKKAKQARGLYGALQHDLFVKNGWIVKQATKDGKGYRLIVKNPKALPQIIAKAKGAKNIPWYKFWKKYKFKPLRYKDGRPYKALGSLENGELTKTGKDYYKHWGMKIPDMSTSKKSLSQKLKENVKSSIDGWKNFGKLKPYQKFLKAGGAGLAVVSTGLDGYDNFNTATKQGLTGTKRVVSTTINTGIDLGTSIAAGAIGAKVGAAAGTLAGPLGTVAGATVGFVVGLGVSAGINYLAKPITNALKNGVNHVIKNGIGKTVNDVSKKINSGVNNIKNKIGNAMNPGNWSFG